jgi:hypothetical protein
MVICGIAVLLVLPPGLIACGKIGVPLYRSDSQQ